MSDLRTGLCVLAIAVFAPGDSLATAPAFDFNAAFDEAIRQAAEDQGLRLDPQVAADIKSDAGNFVFNFCSANSINDSNSACRIGLGDADSRAALIGAFLHDSLTADREIDTVAERLARRAGSSIALAGWPGQRDKTTGFVRVPISLQQASISLQTATGAVDLIGNGAVVLLNAGSQGLVAVDDANSTTTVVIDIVAGKEAVWGNGRVADVTGRIGISADNFCTSDPPPAPTDALSDFNWGRSTWLESDEERKKHTIPVASQVALDIDVIDETGKCAADCELGLGVAFAKAVAIWRSGCERCGKQSLSSIRVGNHTWLDRRVVERLRMFDSDSHADSLDLASPSLSDYVLSSAPSLSVPTVSSVGYEMVESQSEAGRKLCAISSKEEWVVGAQGLLCAKSRFSTPGELRPKLFVLSRPTDCGKPAIACGVPGGVVEITTDDYSFSVDSPSGAITLGESPNRFEAGPVILHEVGHWFGVPHPESANVGMKDVMTGEFNPEKTCVSAASLAMLNNASDDRWKYRANANQGLLPPPNIQHTVPGDSR